MPAGGYPRPRKRLGQHFLSDRRILGRIVDALELTGVETVLEVGPGRGALTDLLADRAARVVAVELDRDLAAILRARYAADARVQIVEADVLASDLAALAGGPFRLVGNVPYYITTPIVFHALQPPRPERAVYLVQREVADRMVARAGSPAYGALSVNVQAVARAELLFTVPAGAFHPAPKVDSAVIRLTPLAEPVIAPAEEERFRGLVQGAFGLRRKQMARVVRTLAGLSAPDAEAVLAAADIPPTVRPEEVDVVRFARLLRGLPS